MSVDLSVSFTGIRFENPFLLASAPPTESESNILHAFEAGWGGVVTKTIGMHPVVNVAGPKTKFLRHHPESSTLSMNRGRGGSTALVVELGPHLRQAARLVAATYPSHQAGVSGAGADRLDHGGIGQRHRARITGARLPRRARTRARTASS